MRGGMVPSLLGAGLLVAAAVSPAVVENPWGERCHLAWCEPTPVQSAHPVDPVDDALQRAADRAELEHGRRCVEPGAWQAGQVPASMVLESGGRLERVPWSYPAPEGTWVLSVCAR